MNDISMLVTKNLELDMMRLFNELLQINRASPKEDNDSLLAVV